MEVGPPSLGYMLLIVHLSNILYHTIEDGNVEDKSFFTTISHVISP
jgi:hypothetical protein